MNIDGKTEIYAILGDPIKQVTSPELMNAIYNKNGANKVLIPLQVNQNSLEATINGLKKNQNFQGPIITMPNKTEIVKYLDKASNEVQVIGACNVIKRSSDGIIRGVLLEGKGFVQGLKTHNYTLESKGIFLIGSGGAASAIAFALCENKIKN